MSPASNASRNADTNTPVPPICVSAAAERSPSVDDRDDLDRRAERVGDEVGLGARERAGPGADAQGAGGGHASARLLHGGDRLGGGRVEVEQLAQGGGVLVAAGRRGEFLDPHGRGVQHLLDGAAHRVGDLAAHGLRQHRAAGRRAGPARRR